MNKADKQKYISKLINECIGETIDNILSKMDKIGEKYENIHASHLYKNFLINIVGNAILKAHDKEQGVKIFAASSLEFIGKLEAWFEDAIKELKERDKKHSCPNCEGDE